MFSRHKHIAVSGVCKGSIVVSRLDTVTFYVYRELMILFQISGLRSFATVGGDGITGSSRKPGSRA